MEGLFTVQLDFGGVFKGDARWLEIGVDCGDGAVTLSPRQPLTPAPYALALPGLWTEQDETSPNVVGGHRGNNLHPEVAGATISGGGDSTYPNGITADYGTVGGGRGNEAGQVATVGGGETNTASGPRATVGGGDSNAASGDRATVGGGYHNTANGDRATVSGGHDNSASGSHATVSGGLSNSAVFTFTTISGGEDNRAEGLHTTVSGGGENTARGWRSTVGGGHKNTAHGYDTTIGGGSYNRANDWHATIAGGENNVADGWAAAVSGGYSNSASDRGATVSGGLTNTVSAEIATVGGGGHNNASGYGSTVPGGYLNAAQGNYSFAAGRQAKANNQGCFVWGDATEADVTCDDDNAWVARASGGVTFYSNSSLSSGVHLAPGASQWTALPAPPSDRALKENVSPVDAQEVLEQVASLPISTWIYESDSDVRHMGPMAQDFHAAFGLGKDDKHIHTVDADGVALASIQGLYNVIQEKEMRISEVEADNAALKGQVDDLEARVQALEGLIQEGGAQEADAQAGFSLDWLLAAGALVGGFVLWQRRREGGASWNTP